ncbi:hypothetical protein AAE02nite_07790 [Adhaeribacter aerolatus]|uniref:Uncharacterized protein n=2 Tax=Adhaeribacter aerolatus TaxID=670289 RepID=A0A512ATS6_9BACT|nr:hypothetical protein AAE02nite_07790 [Adhaeribacter aerolatus]
MFGMCGLLLTVGSLINWTASKKEICDGFLVIDKQKIEYRYRSQPGANLLFVNMHGVTERLRCKNSFWSSTSVGDKISLCVYDSPLGFDFIEISEE